MKTSRAEYALITIRWVIAIKEKNQHNATNEKELLSAWLKDKEYFDADEKNRRAGRYDNLTGDNGQLANNIVVDDE